jgi:hypothetical protein
VKNEVDGNSVATVVLRGSTDSILDDLERAVDDGVNTYKVLPTSLIITSFWNICSSLTIRPSVKNQH